MIDSPVAIAAALRRTSERIRVVCEVPDGGTVTDFAEKRLSIVDGGAIKGPYRCSLTPYQRRWQDLIADPSVPRIVLCWASQLGKTTVIRNGLAYRMKRMPSAIIAVQPKIDRAETWAKEEIDVMIRATKVLRDIVGVDRARGATLRFKPFPGGYLFIASAQSATELASRSSAFVVADEVDRYEILAEGNPLKIIEQRMAAQDIGLLLATSTPGEHDTSLIWPALEEGTNERCHVPCPHCGVAQELEWGGVQEPFGVKWPSGKPLLAEYMCRHCAQMISEKHKTAMLAEHQWVVTNEEGTYPSSHLSSLYSPFGKSRWGILAEQFVSAGNKPADLQVFMNTRLARTWKEGTFEVKSDDLAARATERFEEFVVPHGVGVLTCGVDVQDNRIEMWVWGWGKALESWPIAHILLTGDPTIRPGDPGSLWDEVDRKRVAFFRHESGQRVKIAMTFVDSGHATTTVYRYTDRRKGRGVYACKGVGLPGQPLLGKPSLETIGRVVVYPVGDHQSKSEFLRSQILVKEPGPGFVHLPQWMTLEQIDQLVAEKRTRKVRGGKAVVQWKPKEEGAPNEALDCRRYARAALEKLGNPVIQNLEKRAARWSVLTDDNGEVITAGVATVEPPVSIATERRDERVKALRKTLKKSFVTGWKR